MPFGYFTGLVCMGDTVMEDTGLLSNFVLTYCSYLWSSGHIILSERYLTKEKLRYFANMLKNKMSMFLFA